MNDRIAQHFGLFNEAVRTKNWTAFMTTFTPDAVMRFVELPAYVGRAAIAAAYQESPPDDTMTVLSDRRDGDTDVVRFAWDAGGTGTMEVIWRDGMVASLSVAFD
jgi:steroid Delta-isomerase